MYCENKNCDMVINNEVIEDNFFNKRKYMFGHAYVPNQVYKGNSFNPEEGLENGTMFKELVSPYMPLDSMRVIELLRNGGINSNDGM